MEYAIECLESDLHQCKTILHINSGFNTLTDENVKLWEGRIKELELAIDKLKGGSDGQG